MAISYGAACGPGCGYCGLCTAAYDRPNEPDEAERCLACGVVLERVSIAVLISKYVSGAVCSEHCLAKWNARSDMKAS